MNGYLRFLKSLSQYQQRAEIGRLAFAKRWGGSFLQEDLLQDAAIITYSNSLGVKPASWEFDLDQYVEEPDLIGAPVFCENQCRASFTLCYEHVSGKNLVITGIIYVEDNQSALIGTLVCSSIQEESCRARRLVASGIDPKTLKTVRPYLERLRHSLYLDYLKALLPCQRREAIFHLADVVFGTEVPRRLGSLSNPLFINHPKLAPELAGFGIKDLCEAARTHQVGPIEFAAGQCTAPIWYTLYGEGEDSKYDEGGFGHCVEVHILAGVGNKPGGGGDIWVQDLWSRIDSIDDPLENWIPLLVP
jgi:hypothetical protein